MTSQPSQKYRNSLGYAGLEVVPDQVDKVVVPDNIDKVVLPNEDYHGKEVFSETAGHTEKSRSFWARKRFIFAALIGLAIVITASAVGGVYGSKPSHNRDPSVTTPTPGTTSTSSSATVSPTSITSRSPLAVVGAQSEDQSKHGVLLTYETPDKTIRLILGSNIDNSTETIWGAPQPLEVGKNIANGTGLAVTSITNTTGGVSEQYFIDDAFILQSMVEDSGSRRQGYQLSGLGKKKIAVAAGSKIASYGPWVIVQMFQGYFLAIWHEISQDIWYSLDLHWINEVMPGTKISIVPLATTFTKLSEGHVGFIFQQYNGRLMAFSSPDDFKLPVMPPTKTKTTSQPTQTPDRQDMSMLQIPQSSNRSWPPSDQFPEIKLRLGASFSALAVARSDKDDEILVNTFILYQDDDSDIKQVWTEDGLTWRKSSPSALKVADNGTDIACLTLSTWDGSKIVEPAKIWKANYMARCYFQRGGAVVEARLHGTDWFEHSTLPIP